LRPYIKSSQPLCQSILAHIQINFTGDSDNEEVVSTRKTPNLPKEIRGSAQWIDKDQGKDGQYEVHIKTEACPIEYINRHWYWINHKEGFWWTCQRAQIKAPQKYYLGTKNRPFIESPDQRRIELAGVFSESESEEKSQTQITDSDIPTNDPQEDKVFEEATRDLKMLQLVTEVTEEIEEDEPMSQIATKMDVTQISFLGIPPMSPTQATSYAGGHIGLATAGPSHSTLPASGVSSGPSRTIQTVSGMVGSGGQTGGTASQPIGVASGQGSGPSTRTPATGGPTLQGTQPSGGSGSGGGGGGGSSGGGVLGPPVPPPGRQAAVQGAPIAGPLPAANGVLRGHPPEIFDGQRKNTQKFVKEFTLWKMCNLQNEAMTNPFQRIVLALSYIKGPRVDDWVTKTSDNTVRKVFGDPQAIPPIMPIYADNDKNLWNEFVNEFGQAYADLSKLEMKGDEIDKYIAMFKHLLARAGWDQAAHGSIEMFKQGLQKGIHTSILQKDPLPIGIDQWQAAA